MIQQFRVDYFFDLVKKENFLIKKLLFILILIFFLLIVEGYSFEKWTNKEKKVGKARNQWEKIKGNLIKVEEKKFQEIIRLCEEIFYLEKKKRIDLFQIKNIFV